MSTSQAVSGTLATALSMRAMGDELRAKDKLLTESRAEIARLNSVLSMFREMADAAEAEYWAYNKAHLDMQPSRERVFDALKLLGRYPPPGENIIPPADEPEA